MSFYCIITPQGWVREGEEITKFETLEAAVNAKVPEPNHVIPMSDDRELQEFIMGRRRIPTFNVSGAR